MKVKKKGWWLDRLWVELVVAAFGALLLDLHSRVVDLERRKDINAVPSISRDDGKRRDFRFGPKDPEWRSPIPTKEEIVEEVEK